MKSYDDGQDLAVRGESRARSRARDLRSLARHKEEVDAWLSSTTRNTASGRKPLAPFGLRAAQAHLLCCPSATMLEYACVGSPCIWTHGAPQRDPWDFHHGLLEALRILKDVLPRAYGKDYLMASVRETFYREAEDRDLGPALEWLRSPVGTRIAVLEAEAGTSRGPGGDDGVLPGVPEHGPRLPESETAFRSG